MSLSPSQPPKKLNLKTKVCCNSSEGEPCQIWGAPGCDFSVAFLLAQGSSGHDGPCNTYIQLWSSRRTSHRCCGESLPSRRFWIRKHSNSIHTSSVTKIKQTVTDGVILEKRLTMMPISTSVEVTLLSTRLVTVAV